MQSAELDWGPEDDWDAGFDWDAVEQEASKRLKVTPGYRLQSEGSLRLQVSISLD